MTFQGNRTHRGNSESGVASKLSAGAILFGLIIALSNPVVFLAGGFAAELFGAGSAEWPMWVSLEFASLVTAAFSLLFLFQGRMGSFVAGSFCIFVPLRFVYHSTIGTKVVFGDSAFFLDLGRAGAEYWNTFGFGAIDLNFLAQTASRYAASTYFLGLPFYFYDGNETAVMGLQVSIQLSLALLLLLGARVGDLGLTGVKCILLFALAFPELLALTSTPARDTHGFVAVALWLSGQDIYSINPNARQKLIALLMLVVGFITMSSVRQIYGLLMLLQLLLSIVFLGKEQRSSYLRALAVLLPVAVIAVAVTTSLTKSDVSAIGDLETMLSVPQMLADQMSTGWEGESRGAGTQLAAGQGGSIVLAIPIRILMGLLAPFPWTRVELFEAELGGFNSSYSILIQHIIRVVVSFVMLILLYRQYLSRSEAGKFERARLVNGASLALLYLIVGSLSATGFFRYLMPAFVAMAVPLSNYVCRKRDTLVRDVSDAATISVVGLFLTHIIYYGFNAILGV